MNLSVIGVGKLGICFALNAELAGHNVIGVDTNIDYINKINNRTLVSPEPEVETLLKNSKLHVYNDIKKAVEHSDIYFLFVQTPSLPDGTYDHSRIDSVCNELISLHTNPSKKINIVICSTVMPGYCKKLQERLRNNNVVVCYNPEFIAQGSIIHDQRNPGLILVGSEDKDLSSKVSEVHNGFRDNDAKTHITSLTTAELTKIGINCFLTIKTSYANLLGDLAFSLNESPENLLEIIGSDHRVGSKRFKYGFGYGGPCLPRDNRALAMTAKTNGMYSELLYAADKANVQHLFKYADVLISKIPNGSKDITINGVSYKEGTSILEESQQLATAVYLADSGYNVTISDTYEIISNVKKLYGNKFIYKVV